MDCVAETLLDGRWLRALTVVDNWSRHRQLIEPAFTLTGTTVVAALERVAKRTGSPQMITVANGSECTSKALDAWAHEHGVQLDLIRPGKPVENAVIESFNGWFRTECLNTQVFVSLHDARQKIETWRIDDNEHRPHGSLGDLPPQEFVEQTAETGLQQASNFQHGVVYFLGKGQYRSQLPCRWCNKWGKVTTNAVCRVHVRQPFLCEQV
jgi:putative transposase